MLLLHSCCCGFQELGQGLFIFALFDVLINLVMLGLTMAVGSLGLGPSMGALLILADIALATGAKLQVGGLEASLLNPAGEAAAAGLAGRLRGAHPPVGGAAPHRPPARLHHLHPPGQQGVRQQPLPVPPPPHLQRGEQVGGVGHPREGHVWLVAVQALRLLLGLLYSYFWLLARSLFVRLGEAARVQGKGQGGGQDRLFTRPPLHPSRF